MGRCVPPGRSRRLPQPRFPKDKLKNPMREHEFAVWQRASAIENVITEVNGIKRHRCASVI